MAFQWKNFVTIGFVAFKRILKQMMWVFIITLIFSFIIICMFLFLNWVTMTLAQYSKIR